MESLLNIPPIGIAIILLIIVLTCADLWTYVKDKGRNHRSFRSDVVTVGILGTFLGIFVGLWEFDVNNITASIPLLLEGMKLAFVTSIAGMVSSVGLNPYQKFHPSPYAKTGNPIGDKLSDQSRLLAAFLEDCKASNAAVVKQVKKHRIESRDELVRVRESLDKTLQKLSEGASKEIIQALEDVISDFNKNLTQQFGENFKQLNEACLKLVNWQEQHIKDMQAVGEALAATKDSLQSTAASLSEIANRNEEFEEFCNRVSLSLTTMNTLLNNTTRLHNEISASIAKLNEVARELHKVPAAFHAVATAITDNNKRIIDSFNETKKTLDNYITQLLGRINKLIDDLKQAMNNLNSALVSLTKQFGKDYRNFLEQIRKIMP